MRRMHAGCYPNPVRPLAPVTDLSRAGKYVWQRLCVSLVAGICKRTDQTQVNATNPQQMDDYSKYCGCIGWP
jgi:hypothetical protein